MLDDPKPTTGIKARMARASLGRRGALGALAALPGLHKNQADDRSPDEPAHMRLPGDVEIG